MRAFICHTPFHLYFVRMLLGQLCFNESIIFYSGDLKAIESAGENNTSVVYLGKAFSSVKKKEEIDRQVSLIKSYDSIDEFFVSDIAWPLNNRIYAYAKDKKLPISIFSDGVGSYLERKIDIISIFRMAVKSFLGCVGVTSPYKLFNGHILGQDEKYINCIYSFDNSNVVCRKETKLFEVKLPRMELDYSNSKKVMFLDQELSPFYSPADLSLIRKSAFKYLSSLGLPVFYKKHHLNPSEFEDEARLLGYSILTDHRSAEEIMCEEKYSIIVSFCSSALIHAKIIFGDNIDCIGFELQDVLKHIDSNNYNKMIRLFEFYGVVES